MADSSQPTASNSLNDNLNAVYAHVEASLSESSISSTETADNLPGAGRLLGNLYMFLGRHLEVAASRYAEKLGYGPKAGVKRLMSLCQEGGLRCVVPQERKHQKEVKKLLKYVRSRYMSNQVLALEAIMDFVIHDPTRQVLLDLDAAKIVGLALLQAEAENCDQLLSLSRKALISLVAVDINDLGKDFLELCTQLYLVLPRKENVEQKEAFSHTLRCLVEKARSSLEASFLVLRYIKAAVSSAFVYYDDASSYLKIIGDAVLYVFDHAPSAIEQSVLSTIVFWFYMAIRESTEENIELVRALAARSLGDEQDFLMEYHRNRFPNLYFWESRPQADRWCDPWMGYREYC